MFPILQADWLISVSHRILWNCGGWILVPLRGFGVTLSFYLVWQQ